MPPVFRFAPSPNGYLHLGHALSALLNAERAKAAAGRLLLRIEDIDEARCRPEYEAAIYEDLTWLGIAWERPVRRQSEHYADYRAALARLDAMGLTYRAYETRSEIGRAAAGYDPDGAPLYPGRHNTIIGADERRRRSDAGEPFALRLDMAAARGAYRRVSPGRKLAPVPPAKPAASPPIPPPGAMSSWRARKRPPAITSPSWWMTPPKASPTSCVGETCSPQRASTACCRRCWACPRRATTTTT